MTDKTILKWEFTDLNGPVMTITKAISTSFCERIDNILIETARNVYLDEHGPVDEHVHIRMNKQWIIDAIREKMEREENKDD